MVPKSILAFQHAAPIKPEWRHQANPVNDENYIKRNIISFPKNTANGMGLFLEINSGLSVLVLDLKIKKTLNISRLLPEYKDGFWILHYDLMQEDSKSKNAVVRSELFSKFGFSIFTDQNTNFTIPEKNTFSLIIFIAKSFMSNNLKGGKIIDHLMQNSLYQDHFFSTIDSRSKVILNQLKKNQLENCNFEFLLKGTVYNLLGILLDKHNTFISNSIIVNDRDKESIIKSQNYLLSNLRTRFPGLKTLVQLANMSVSKYMYLYKCVFDTTPFHFFREEKMLLAKELLESGNFKLVRNVAFELGYHKVIYFSRIYKSRFKMYPHQSLKRS